MNYELFNWMGDFMSREIYGHDVDDFVVGVYTLKNHPELTLYIDTEKEKIIDAFIDDIED